MNRLGRAAGRLLSLIVGLGPGLLLPFAIAWKLPAAQSDGYLFSVSFSLIAINVIVVAIENHAIAVIGRQPLAEPLSLRTWRQYLRHVIGRGWATVIVALPLLFLVYVTREPRWAEFWAVVAVVGLAPLAGVCAGVASGVLYASGRPALPITTQGFRSLLPMAVLFTPLGSSVLALAVAFAAGEILRTLVLYLALPRIAAHDGNDDLLRRDGLFWQFGSSGVSQANPLVDRLFLAGGTSGAITAYELADKISFAVYQVFYTGFLQPRSAQWSSSVRVSPRAGVRHFWSTTLVAMGLTLASALLAAVVVVLGLNMHLFPAAWTTGLAWSLWALPSVAFSLGQMASVRFLVTLNAERALLPATLAGFLINLGADFFFFTIFGGVGIVIASLVTRVMVCALYFVVVFQVYRRRAAAR